MPEFADVRGMSDRELIRAFLEARYSAQAWPKSIEYLGSAGGFSGARFWRVTGSGGIYCLRRWSAEHPSRERLAFIHAVLKHVFSVGFKRLPLPIETRQGDTFWKAEGYLWELAPWMPGTADYCRSPSPLRLRRAMQALAEFHQAGASGPDRRELQWAKQAPSPGLFERREQLAGLCADQWEELRSSVEQARGSPYWSLAAKIVDEARPRLAELLAETDEAARIAVPLQPAIRDIWHEHVLFEEDRVTALVDFGSLRVESVCGDVARLLGSLAGDDAAGWECGLDAYQQVRPLSAEERRLVAVFDRTGVVLSGMNWVRWLMVEGRRFEDAARVLARLAEIESRLMRMADG